MIKEISTSKQVLDLIKNNKDKRIFFFKHSTRCPISARAFQEFQEFASKHPEIECYYIDILKDREASNTLAQESLVKHESPQVIVYKNGRPEWTTTHHAITFDVLEKHCRNNASST